MKEQLLHTPEGVRDIYGEEYEKKLKVESFIQEKFTSYGYHNIQTPSFEFFDVFSNEIGTTPSKELYKFFDKEGNTLVLRPDFTPSVARCAAKYFLEENMPLRFSYQGNAFINSSLLQGKLKETTQMGVELIGDESVYSDAEIICLVIDSLLNTGLKNFQISIGNVEYFKGLCNELNFSKELEMTIREYISNKNFFAAEEIMLDHNVSKEHCHILLKTEDYIGSVDMLKEAEKYVHNDRSIAALKHLFALYRVIQSYGFEKYVSFDLGMLSKYQYYTGMIFKGYTYGVGDAIVKGGRYDNLLNQFGKSAPAVGFVIIIDDLMQALSRQSIQIDSNNQKTIVLFEEECFEKALKKTNEIRKNHGVVELIKRNKKTDIKIYKEYANRDSVADFIYIKE